MRAVPTALQAKLDGGVTQLCRCWRVTRRDGVVQGFTDHDDDVMLGALACRAGTGFSGSDATSRLGLAVDGSEIAGALDAETLSDFDLAAGRYDSAQIELYLVDWSEPSLHLLLAKGSLGEVRREGHAFAAEVRGLADRLGQETGRRYGASCAADLGDARCGINLSGSGYRGEGAVLSLDAASTFRTTGIAGFVEGTFDAGKLTFSSGANAGLSVEVKSHRFEGVSVLLDLWQAMPEPIAPGDAFVVTAGCDKRFSTCLERFGNIANFRGFPHIPGNEFVTRYAVDGEAGNDGSPIVV